MTFYSPARGAAAHVWHSERACPSLRRTATVRRHEVAPLVLPDHAWVRNGGDRTARLCRGCLVPALLTWLLAHPPADPVTGARPAPARGQRGEPLGTIERVLIGCPSLKGHRPRRCRLCALLADLAVTHALVSARTDPGQVLLVEGWVPPAFLPVLAQAFAVYLVPVHAPTLTPATLGTAWDLRRAQPGLAEALHPVADGDVLPRAGDWMPWGLTTLHQLGLEEAACIHAARTPTGS